MKRQRTHGGTVAMAACAAILVSGCATSPPAPPDAAMADARSALAQAEQAGGDEYAPGSLARAQEQLDLGVAAARAGRYDDARRLAESAAADAELAAATARARQAQRALDAVEASTQALKDGMARGTPPR